jgi:hypothetical protein
MLHPNEVKLDKTKNTLLLYINKNDVSASLDTFKSEALTHALTPKNEFHITAIGFGTGKILQDRVKSIPGQEKTYKEEELRELIRETSWNFVLENQPAYFLEKEYFDTRNPDKVDVRRSIIQRISLPSLEGFYVNLNALFETSIEVPPAHITLYVGGTDPERSAMGIGIDTEQALRDLHPITLK